MSSAADHQRVTELASNRGVHQAFSWFHLHEQQLREWQTKASAIPAPPFAEGTRATWFESRFRELGLAEVHIDEVGNVLGELRRADAPRSGAVLVSAHLDTVFPAGTDCDVREGDAQLHGPGICDNAAGLTALLALAAALREGSVLPACDVVFAANVGEEGEGNLRGMRHLFGASPYGERVAAAIALEGAGNGTVVDRALGSRRLRVTITGPGGHSWADAGMPNPILALSAGLLAAARIPLPNVPRTTLNCGTISGGTSVNSIPESATADLDLRSSSSAQLDRVELAILEVLTAVVAQRNTEHPTAKLHLSAERIGDRPGGTLSESSALLGSLRAVDRHLGITTESRIGSTDANLPLSRGIPALAIGAGGRGGGMHTLGEWYDPTGRELALRRILLFLLDTCTLVTSGEHARGSLLNSAS